MRSGHSIIFVSIHSSPYQISSQSVRVYRRNNLGQYVEGVMFPERVPVRVLIFVRATNPGTRRGSGVGCSRSGRRRGVL